MKNTYKKILGLVLALSLAAGLLGTGTLKADAASKPKLSKTWMTVKKGSTTTLTVKNKPSGAKVSWTTSKKAVATVSSKGVVKGVKAGAATITCTVRAGGNTCTLKCKVNVPPADKTGYQPKYFTWEREGTEGYNLSRQAVGKYVRADGNAVLYILDWEGESYAYELYVKSQKSGLKNYKVPADGASEQYAWTSISDDWKDAYDDFYKIDIYDKGGHVMKVSAVWDDYMRSHYANPSGTYYMVRMK